MKIQSWVDFKECLSRLNSVSESVAKHNQLRMGEFAKENPELYREYYKRARRERNERKGLK